MHEMYANQLEQQQLLVWGDAKARAELCALMLGVLAPSFEKLLTAVGPNSSATALVMKFCHTVWQMEFKELRETFWGSGSIFPLRIPTRNSHGDAYVQDRCPVLHHTIHEHISIL